MENLGPHISRCGLEHAGVAGAARVFWNLGIPGLYEDALRNGEAQMAEGGALVVNTGIHTGRSANDKFFVREAESEDTINWGGVNKPIDEAMFEAILARQLAHYRGRDLYVQDCWAGADPTHRLGVRVVTEAAWHSLFARNMFIRPSAEELAGFEPGFTILHAPSLEAAPETPGLNSGTYILVSFKRRLVVIGGSSYAGEIKKSVFTVLNYLLPEADILPMHCSVNVGPLRPAPKCC